MAAAAKATEGQGGRTVGDRLAALADFQHGVVTRAQALDAGLSDRQVKWRVTSDRWVRAYPGVFLVEPGRRDLSSTHSAAVLACGQGAVLSHASAAFGFGLLRYAPAQIHVSVPPERRVTVRKGVVVHRSAYALDATEDWQWPPRTSVEQTVRDLAATGSADDAVAIAALACQRGLTWYARLQQELDQRPRHPWRELLSAALADIGDGSESTLEVRFIRDVARPHGLPTGRRQIGTRVGVHDVGFEEQRLLVELDGLAYHSDARSRASDARRDRRGAGSGWLTIRAVWSDVALHYCYLAVDIGAVLRERGWTGPLRACRRRVCAVRLTGA